MPGCVYTVCTRVQLCGQFAPGIANSHFITLLDLQLCTHALAAGGTAVLECTLQYLGSTSQGNKFSKVLYYAVYPEDQSDPAIYRKRGKFSKIRSRWSYAEFNSA